MPDTVCLNTPVNFSNTSNPNSSFRWNFCNPEYDSLKKTNPIIRNNSWPGAISFIESNGNYYGFMLEGIGKYTLTRIDFGRSITGNPSFVSLGDFNGLLDLNVMQEIQIINDDGKFYLFFCGIRSVNLIHIQTLLRVDLGNSIENNSPTITDLSTIGNLNGPVSMSFKKSQDGWFALLANRSGFGSIVKLSFGFNLSNVPTAINYGNFNNTFYSPRQIELVKENNDWFAIFTELVSGRFLKLFYGNSLNNSPTISVIPISTLDSIPLLSYRFVLTKDCNYTRLIAGSRVVNELREIRFTSLHSNPTIHKINVDKPLSPWELNFSNLIIDSVGAHFFFNKTGIPIGTSGDTLFRFSSTNCTNSNLPISTQFNPSPITFTKSGVYLVSLKESPNSINEEIYCKKVVVLNSFASTKQILESCQSETLTLKASFISSSYYWNDASASSSINITQSGVYWVKGADSFCGSNTDSFFVTFNPPPNISISKSNDIDCSNTSVTLTVTGANSYQWLPNRYFEDNTKSTQVVKLDTSTTFSVIGKDNNNCASTKTITVKANFSINTNNYLIPSAFSPNNDGLNDCFSLKHWGDVSNFRLNIYNRYGQIIFSTTNTKKCWDGRYSNGQIADIGAYVYLVTGNNICVGEIKKYGTITLIR